MTKVKKIALLLKVRLPKMKKYCPLFFRFLPLKTFKITSNYHFYSPLLTTVTG